MNPVRPRLLLIDNYDSFTYNLVQAFLVLGAEVQVYRNDEITVEQALALDLTHLCISPGPGRPDDAGVSLRMLAAFERRLPILGVCLGHQSLVQHCGGRIVAADRLMHGKTSLIEHDGRTIYEGLEPPLPGRPLPFPRGGGRQPAGLSRDHRPQRARRDHGCAPPAAAA